MKENKKSMTQSFIDHWLDINCSWNYSEVNLTEISKEQYDVLYKDKKRTEYFYQQDIYYNVDNIAHPLLKVHIIEDYRRATNYDGGYQWWYEFIFKYKGKFYVFSDVGEI